MSCYVDVWNYFGIFGTLDSWKPMIISQSVGLIESLEHLLVMNKWDLGILAMQALTSLEFIESTLSLICK